MSAPTAEELEALKKFRLRVADLGLEKETNLSMLRWIRARELNLDHAEDMLRKHMQWRKEENISEIMDWIAPEMIKANYEFEITGRDAQGRPIPFGDWDVRKALKAGTRDLFLRNIDYMFAQTYAKMKKNSLEFHSEITQCILLVDFANFGMLQLTSISGVNTLLEAVRRFESNYPEILFKLYFVNCFRVFQLFLSLIKPFLSARTLLKMEVYTSPDKWIPVLQDTLPPDQFPVEFGGTMSGRQISVGNALKHEMIDTDYTEITKN